jgi:hypothetical protein
MLHMCLVTHVFLQTHVQISKMKSIRQTHVEEEKKKSIVRNTHTIRDFDLKLRDLVLIWNTAVEKALNRKMHP